MSTEPGEIYRRKLEERDLAVARADRRHAQVAWARLGAFAAIVATVLLVAGRWVPPGGWIYLPFLAFAGLVVWHGRVLADWERAQRARAFYQEGLDRLEGRWMKTPGARGERYLDALHPYQRDLDLFGPASLFEFLCRARTRAGQDCLAEWLSRPAPPAEIERRQAAVQELREDLELREDIATLFAGRSAFGAPAIAGWAQAPVQLRGGPVRWCALVLGLAGAAAMAYWALTFEVRPLLLVAALQQLARPLYHSGLKAVLTDLEPIRSDIKGLIQLFRRLERESFTSPLLAELWEPLRAEPAAAVALGRLQSSIEWLDARRNMLTAPLVYLSLAHLNLAIRCEDWRQRHGPRVGPWLRALAQFEALSSLANLAFERPEYGWPELTPAGSGLQARELGHPLLGCECVVNDVELHSHRLWIVSGSNMSGKSSLLRALGSNVALAMAGAPVRAAQLRLEPLQVGASIQLADSLMGGQSRFYAELLRLRQIVGLAEMEPRLLFLLDEIMAGTNSHDRRIGAEAVVRGLLSRGALGLVTTHDLALTAMADHLEGAANVHLQDHIEGERMVFDYRLRPGVVQHSNALELMRLVGLPVEAGEEERT